MRKVHITLSDNMTEKSFNKLPEKTEITALRDNLRVRRDILGTITNLRFENGLLYGDAVLSDSLPSGHADEFDILTYGSGMIDANGKIYDYTLHGANFIKKR